MPRSREYRKTCGSRNIRIDLSQAQATGRERSFNAHALRRWFRARATCLQSLTPTPKGVPMPYLQVPLEGGSIVYLETDVAPGPRPVSALSDRADAAMASMEGAITSIQR